MEENREEIIIELKNMADAKYKEFHGGLCPGTENILGVRVPKLRAYAKKLANDDWQSNYNCLRNEYYEETMLKGMLIGLAKVDIDLKLEYLKKLIPQIDNWAVCDVTCAGLKFVKKDEEKVWNFLQQYLQSNKEFELRFAIVMLLDHYITDKYINDVIDILNNTKCITYYVRMAVAWAISVIYVKYPRKAMKYLKSKDNKLDDYTYNATLQKIIDSYRVDDKEKDKIREMRRKQNKK